MRRWEARPSSCVIDCELMANASLIRRGCRPSALPLTPPPRSWPNDAALWSPRALRAQLAGAPVALRLRCSVGIRPVITFNRRGSERFPATYSDLRCRNLCKLSSREAASDGRLWSPFPVGQQQPLWRLPPPPLKTSLFWKSAVFAPSVRCHSKPPLPLICFVHSGRHELALIGCLHRSVCAGGGWSS